MAFLNVLQLFQKVLTSLPGVEQVLKRRYSSQPTVEFPWGLRPSVRSWLVQDLGNGSKDFLDFRHEVGG